MGRMNKNKEQEMDGGTYIGKKVGTRIRKEKWRDVGKKEGRRKKGTRHGGKGMEEEYEQEMERCIRSKVGKKEKRNNFTN